METIQLAVDESLHESAQHILSERGLTMEEAFDMFLHTVVEDGDLRALSLPNTETIAAMKEAESGTLKGYDSVDTFMKSLYEDD